MTKHVLTDQKLIVGAYDITGSTNAIALEYSAEEKDCTVYGNDTRAMLGGLKKVQVQAGGFYDAVPLDSPLFNAVGVADSIISMFTEGTADGDVAYFFKAMAGKYDLSASVGDLFKYSLGAGASQGPLVRGVLLNDSTETASGDGSAIQVGAASSSQKVYAAVHVLESSGSGDQTLDVTIGSDDNAGFTSETNRFTFTQTTTAVTSQLLILDGPITDDYYRVNFAIAGSGSPSFKIAVLLGVK